MYRYWGKAHKAALDLDCHLLPYHSLDVAAVGWALLDVHGVLQQRIAHSLGLAPEPAAAWLTFLLALHDIGKFSEQFQNLNPSLFRALRGRSSNKQYTVRHDALGLLAWQQHLRYSLADLFPSVEPQMLEELVLIPAVTGHHGQPPRLKSRNSQPLDLRIEFTSDDRQAVTEFARELTKLLLPLEAAQMGAPLSTPQAKRASWLVAGLCVLCDWLGSNEKYFGYHQETMPLAKYWNEIALPAAREAVAKSGLVPSKCNTQQGVAHLFPSITEPSPLQRFCEQVPLSSGGHLFILEDVTGSGKTEAALTLAHRLMAHGEADGVFVALPTMATANAMYRRMAEAYRRMFAPQTQPSLVLSHGARHLDDVFQHSILTHESAERNEYMEGEPSAGAICTAWLADGRKKAFLADAGVGTVDQALLAVLPSRHQCLRLLGLSGKVLIVDEVHSYDTYMHTLLREVLRFHAAFGGSAILLSATLPQSIRRSLAESYTEGLGTEPPALTANGYPLATWLHAGGSSEKAVTCREDLHRRVRVECVLREEDVHARILNSAERGQCVCWVRNTVADAIEAHRMLAKSLPQEKLTLFHARFAMGDRLDIEETVRARFGPKSTSTQRAGQVLVATQVVEQSLDLDFDLMVTDLAPMDLILQRAGRLHRHNRGSRDPPLLLVHGPPAEPDAPATWFSSAFKKGAFVYPIHSALWRTMHLLEARAGWTLPDEARSLIESVFGASMLDAPCALLDRDVAYEGKQKGERDIAQFNALRLDQGYEATGTQWLPDTITPTRLGEPVVTVRLARWAGGRLSPWFAHPLHPWDFSQLSVSQYWLSAVEEPREPALKEALRSACVAMPDQGRWSLLVPLQEQNGEWKGRARDARGHSVMVTYSTSFGLLLEKEKSTDDPEPDP